MPSSSCWSNDVSVASRCDGYAARSRATSRRRDAERARGRRIFRVLAAIQTRHLNILGVYLQNCRFDMESRGPILERLFDAFKFVAERNVWTTLDVIKEFASTADAPASPFKGFYKYLSLGIIQLCCTLDVIKEFASTADAPASPFKGFYKYLSLGIIQLCCDRRLDFELQVHYFHRGQTTTGRLSSNTNTEEGTLTQESGDVRSVEGEVCGAVLVDE